MCSSSNKCVKPASIFEKSPYSLSGPWASNIWATSLHLEINGQLGISPWMNASFQGPISSVSWLACQLLAHKLAPVHRGEAGIKKRGRLFQMKGWAVFINKETYYDTYLRCQKKRRSPHPPARILEVCIEALMGFSCVFCANGFNNTLHCVLEKDSHCGNSGQNIHSMEGGGSEEPPVTRVQLMSFRWPPLTTTKQENEELDKSKVEI